MGPGTPRSRILILQFTSPAAPQGRAKTGHWVGFHRLRVIRFSLINTYIFTIYTCDVSRCNVRVSLASDLWVSIATDICASSASFEAARTAAAPSDRKQQLHMHDIFAMIFFTKTSFIEHQESSFYGQFVFSSCHL